LDPDAVAQAVASAEPEVIVHELTALSGEMSARAARHPDRSPMFAMTSRLRTEGTDHLLAAGQGVGARRFVAQSFAAFRFTRTGGPALGRTRLFPIIGDGGGGWSHVHVDDAAAATALAVDRGGSGIYNIVDDQPAPVREWPPALASALGAKPPRRIPRWLGRLAAGEAATVVTTDVRGASNEKAKRELGWQPRYASWRQGSAQGLG
ncbi:MAG: NAD-dependent epimerase/dehydratase family protein, partial [Solirubrobacteraceae bacterium]